MKRNVVICGVDTSRLPRLTAKETRDLMQKVKEGEPSARSRFILSNIRLVLSVVQKYTQKTSHIDDIFQVGCVGLVKSVDNFNMDLNVKFSTYAVPMIVGEIRRYLRESNSMRISRSIRDTAYLALQARDRIEAASSDSASLGDIANELGKSVSEIVFALDAISHPVSLYDPVYNDGQDAVLVMDQVKDVKNSDDNWVTEMALYDAIIKLSEREKSILKKRYFEGKTQIEISNEVGISQAQVSRLEKNAVEHIRQSF